MVNTASRQPAVLHEDNHLLVLDKPAGMPTIGTGADAPGLVGWGREYLRDRYQKPGNVFLGVVSRLDALVTGVIVLARTSKAAARLSEQFRERSVRKTYVAVLGPGVERTAPAQPLPTASNLTHHVWRDEAHHRMAAVSAESAAPAGSQRAELGFRPLAESGGLRLVEVELVTGRKHQIRVQFAALGWPVVGDAKYGSAIRFARGIALHSRRLELDHPTRNNRLDWLAPLPESWPAWAKNGLKAT